VAVQDVIGGHAQAVVADMASTAQLVKQGRLRYLAVSTAKRVKGWEDVPAIAELVPNFDMMGWFAVVAPTGTPAAVINRLNKEINVLLADAEVSQRILTIGPIAESFGAPERLGEFLAKEDANWKAVAKEIGLLPE